MHTNCIKSNEQWENKRENQLLSIHIKGGRGNIIFYEILR